MASGRLPLLAEQTEFYSERGYLVVNDAVSPELIAEAVNACDRLVDRSRELKHSDGHFELERGHSADQPRVGRVKEPIALDPTFRALCLSDRMLDMVGLL